MHASHTFVSVVGGGGVVGAPFSSPAVRPLGTAVTARAIGAMIRARGRCDSRGGMMGRFGILREMVERTSTSCRNCSAWISSVSIFSMEDIDGSCE